MGAGGIIIIRNKVAEVASLEIIQQHITPAKCAELQAILAKQKGDWTRAEFRKVLKIIAAAEAQC